MADSYIYTLPQTTNPSLTDYTVVDASVLSAAGNYITSKATLLTIAQVTSGTIATALTSQQSIANWDAAYNTIKTTSADWVSTTTTVQSNSSTWSDGGIGYIISTGLQAASSNWQSSYETVSALSSIWSAPAINSQTILQEISAGVFDVQTLSTFESPTTLTATGEFMMVTVNGQQRAIQLWQY